YALQFVSPGETECRRSREARGVGVFTSTRSSTGEEKTMSKYRYLPLGLAALALACFAAGVLAQARSAVDRDKPAVADRDKDKADRPVTGRIVRVDEEKRLLVLGVGSPKTTGRPGAGGAGGAGKEDRPRPGADKDKT